MISNIVVLEDESYPKEVTKYLHLRFKSIEVLDLSDLSLGLGNNAKKCTVTS